MSERDFIAVIDFGGQYAHLIAKRVRHLGVYTRVFPPLADAAELAEAKGVILSGGPESVFGASAIPFNPDLLALPSPLLGLCYGHQLLTQHHGGGVEQLGRGEFGRTALRLTEAAGAHPLLRGVEPRTDVWMSHGDTVTAPPPGYVTLASTDLCPVAAMAHESRPVYGLQFHPEVSDTPYGIKILGNFVALTGAAHGWSMAAFIDEALAECRAQVGDRNVLMFLSGGVDSTVAYALLTRALGNERIKGLLIDNAFLRKDEARGILERYAALGFSNVEFLDASPEFMAAIAGLTDPQKKRQAVGETFLRVREDYLAAQNLDPAHWLLGQGTLYPDIIESGGSHHAEVIKFHHNRVERIQELLDAGHVVEPLKELYKDEVRTLGSELGLPDEIVWRHPFPGPGLSINVLCAAGDEQFPELAPASVALDSLLDGTPYSGAVLPVRSVGVQGDSRTYTPPAVIIGPRDWDALEEQSIRITNGLRSINRVVMLLAPEALPTLHLRPADTTKARLDLLREADHLTTRALEDAGLMREVFQLLVILLPLAAEGAAGADAVGTSAVGTSAVGSDALVLRPVVSEDVMTARFARLPWPLLEELVPRLLALPGVSAVFYDVTHKPPATFGWE